MLAAFAPVTFRKYFMIWAFGILILGIVTGASVVAGFNTEGG